MKLLQRIVDVYSSLWLSALLLSLLALLTWLGTLEQVDHGLYEVQKKYFESFFLFHEVGPISIPLPGANLVMWLLLVNIVIGGIVRMRKTKATIGVLITHLGIILLLVAGFVKNYFSTDGHITLFEGESADYYQSYYRWEVAILEEQADGTVAEHILNHDQVAGCIGAEGRVFRSSTLPFEVRLTHFLKNSRPMPKGPMFEVKVPVADGLFLSELEPEPEAEANVAGVCVTVTGRDGSQQSGLLWGVERAPLTVRMAGKRYGLTLRHERYPMPFEVQLLDFIKEDHPRMAMAKAFESDVKVREDGSERTVKIEMNAPLRDRGLVLYQASWGPQNAGPQTPLFSTLSVVSNPADQYPFYACIVIAVGMLLHFLMKLARYLRSQQSKREAVS
ncbi:MAG: hypothetical protein RL277_755 [Planctomycetota bacterium]